METRTTTYGPWVKSHGTDSEIPHQGPDDPPTEPCVFEWRDVNTDGPSGPGIMGWQFQLTDYGREKFGLTWDDDFARGVEKAARALVDGPRIWGNAIPRSGVKDA